MGYGKKFSNRATVIAIIMICLAEVTILTGKAQEIEFGHSATKCSMNCRIIGYEKLEKKLVKAVNNLASLIRLDFVNISTDTNNSPNDSCIHPNMWHWALDSKGEDLMTLPYDYSFFSLGTLAHGICTEEVMVECDDDNTGSSMPPECVFEPLLKLVNDVSQTVEKGNEEYDFVSLVKSQLCQEYLFPVGIFHGTKVPGYSIYELQSRSKYRCHVKQPNETDFKGELDMIEEYNCTTIQKLFYSITFVITVIVLIVWIGHPMIRETQKEAQGDQRPSIVVTTKRSKKEKTVNILNISLILPIDLVYPAASEIKQNHRILAKYLGKMLMCVVYSLPCTIYMVIYLVYVIFEKDYCTRRKWFDDSHKVYFLLDVILANILYLIGIALYCGLYQKVNKKHPISLKVNKKHPICLKVIKKYQIFLIILKIVVFALCSFRISALIWLLIEFVGLIIYGIIINAESVGATWVNVISGFYFVLKSVLAFFDRYQRLFRNIYLIQIKIDRENANLVEDNEENRQAIDAKGVNICSQNTQSEIPVILLQEIISKYLPLGSHVKNTILFMIPPLVFLVVVTSVVYHVESNATIAVLIEYFVVIVSSAAVASDRMTGKLCLSRDKNLRKEELNSLTEYLRSKAKEKGIDKEFQ